MQRRIGIVGASTGENSFGTGKHYLNFASLFGIPHILMPDEDIQEDLSLLILPGGLDINPANYDEAPGFYTSNQDVFKEYFYLQKLQGYIDAGVPVFGICLGLQQLNVHFGGKLTQNLYGHPQSPDRFRYAHSVVPADGKHVGFEVNSHHHQGVFLSQLGAGLKPLLYEERSENKKVWVEKNPLVEAFVHESLPVAAVQFHPEEVNNHFTMELIESIIRK